jgi:glycerol-3-phosphate dehydrogenase
MSAAAYDVVVIGGGIQGTGIAYAAAAAGHSVLLLEKNALATGTSCKSSKLIHGGLRYLESGQLSLVRESLRERRILLDIAPDLVKLKPFYIPVYDTTRRRPWQLRVGLSAYAVLGGFGPGASFGVVPRREWSELDGLQLRGLRTVFRYHDGQTDDAALTHAVMRTAQSLGAELAMPATFLGADLGDSTVTVRYANNGAERECEGRVLVSAAGAWAAEVADRITPTVGVPPLELVQGTHLIVPGKLTHGLYYVESPRDGRAIFVMPWKGQTLVGTTETRFRGDPDEVEPLLSEKQYLVNVMRHYFPRHANLSVRDLSGAFAGLRVLPSGPGHAFHRSREVLISPDRLSHPRFVGVYGGKLTAWRATAEQVMDRIGGSLPARPPRADTRTHRLVM